MRRPLWTYRPWPCLIGWHAWAWRRAATTVYSNGFHATEFQLIGECDRPGCTAVKRWA